MNVFPFTLPALIDIVSINFNKHVLFWGCKGESLILTLQVFRHFFLIFFFIHFKELSFGLQRWFIIINPARKIVFFLFNFCNACKWNTWKWNKWKNYNIWKNFIPFIWGCKDASVVWIVQGFSIFFWKFIKKNDKYLIFK